MYCLVVLFLVASVNAGSSQYEDESSEGYSSGASSASSASSSSSSSSGWSSCEQLVQESFSESEYQMFMSMESEIDSMCSNSGGSVSGSSIYQIIHNYEHDDSLSEDFHNALHTVDQYVQQLSTISESQIQQLFVQVMQTGSISIPVVQTTDFNGDTITVMQSSSTSTSVSSAPAAPVIPAMHQIHILPHLPKLHPEDHKEEALKAKLILLHKLIAKLHNDILQRRKIRLMECKALKKRASAILMAQLMAPEPEFVSPKYQVFHPQQITLQVRGWLNQVKNLRNKLNQPQFFNQKPQIINKLKGLHRKFSNKFIDHSPVAMPEMMKLFPAPLDGQPIIPDSINPINKFPGIQKILPHKVWKYVKKTNKKNHVVHKQNDKHKSTYKHKQTYKKYNFNKHHVVRKYNKKINFNKKYNYKHHVVKKNNDYFKHHVVKKDNSHFKHRVGKKNKYHFKHHVVKKDNSHFKHRVGKKNNYNFHKKVHYKKHLVNNRQFKQTYSKKYHYEKHVAPSMPMFNNPLMHKPNMARSISMNQQPFPVIQNWPASMRPGMPTLELNPNAPFYTQAVNPVTFQSYPNTIQVVFSKNLIDKMAQVLLNILISTFQNYSWYPVEFPQIILPVLKKAIAKIYMQFASSSPDAPQVSAIDTTTTTDEQIILSHSVVQGWSSIVSYISQNMQYSSSDISSINQLGSVLGYYLETNSNPSSQDLYQALDFWYSRYSSQVNSQLVQVVQSIEQYMQSVSASFSVSQVVDGCDSAFHGQSMSSSFSSSSSSSSSSGGGGGGYSSGQSASSYGNGGYSSIEQMY